MGITNFNNFDEKVKYRVPVGRELTNEEVDTNFQYLSNPWSSTTVYEKGRIVYVELETDTPTGTEGYAMYWAIAKVALTTIGVFDLNEWDVFGSSDRSIGNYLSDAFATVLVNATQSGTFSLATNAIFTAVGSDVFKLKPGTGITLYHDTSENMIRFNTDLNPTLGGNSLTIAGETVDLSPLTTGYTWARDSINGYLYPDTLTDSVGIGTVTPTESLHIDGTVRIEGILAGTTNDVLIKTSGDVLRYRTANSAIWTGSNIVIGSGIINYVPKWNTGGTSLTDSSIIDTGTGVGIGVTPTELLHVNGAIRIGSSLVGSADLGNIRYSGDDFEGYTSAGGWVSFTASALGVSGYSGYSGVGGIQGLSGTSGYSGWSGSQGAAGDAGDSGYSGASGYSGEGTSGFSGFSGWSGDSGWSGYSGESGYSGSDGAAAASGYSGYSGTDGASGWSGTDGASGYSGYSGVGTSGYSGVGTSGYSGLTGTSGYSGYSGLDGVGSASGYSGYSGVSGATAESGYSGYSGTDGTSGYSGYSGTSGYSGYSGTDGTSGYSGYSGYSGETSTSGYSGYSGAAGSRWLSIADIDGTNTGTSGIDTSSSYVGIVKSGQAVKYTIGGTEQRGVITSVAAGSIYITGPPLDGTISAASYSPYGQMVERLAYLVNGEWADGTTNTLLETDLLISGGDLWTKTDAYLVNVSTITLGTDTGTITTEAKINVRIKNEGGSFVDVLSSSLEPDTGVIASSLVTVNESNYDLDFNSRIEISVPSIATGSSPNNDATDLSVWLTIIHD